MKLFKVIRTTACGVKFATRVGITVGSNMLQGVANVADVAGRAAKKTARGDWDGLERLAERTARGVGRSIENKCTAAGELFSEAERCIANPDRRFLTKKNAARVAAVATAAVTVAAGASALDLDVVSDVDVDGLPDADGAGGALASGFAPSDLSVENGVFTGDGQELDRLIQYGEVDGTTHVASEDIVRDIGARDAFLSVHGFDGVPEGYEVHHVVPLSEGGADTPDNMILVSEADHAAITSAHAGFYGWRD